MVPRSILASDITDGAKLLVSEIGSVCRHEGGECKKTNAYFMTVFQKTERTIERWLKELAEAKFIAVKLERKGRTRSERTIVVKGAVLDVVQTYPNKVKLRLTDVA